jgi:hypothetical protein
VFPKGLVVRVLLVRCCSVEQREKNPQEGGQKEEGVEAWEKKVGMDLEEGREYSSSIPGKIENATEETAP